MKITEESFPEVRSRQEMYLQDIIKSLSNESISDNNYPDPLSRQEAYLQIIISKLRANDPNIEIKTEDIEKAVNKYLEQNPIQSGATENQAKQIEENKKDVASLKAETDSLEEDIDNLSSSKISKFYATSNGENHLADSDNGKIADMMVYGRSEQKSTTGAQLLDFSDLIGKTETQNGATYKINEDQSVSVSGTPTKYTSFYLKGISLKAGSYYFIDDQKSSEFFIQLISKGHMNGKFTLTEDMDASVYIVFNVGENNTKTFDSTIKAMLNTGSTALPWEPYTGGQPSPSPDYPQEIKSVVNPTVKVTNEDGLKVKSVTLNNITLNAIPVSSGGNVTINGQQYVADYVDVKRGKVIRNILKWRLADLKYGFNNVVWHMNISELGIDGSKIGLSNMFKIQNGKYNAVTTSEIYIATDGKSASLNMRGMTDEEFKKWLIEKNPEVYNVLTVAEEIPITLEEASAFKQLMSYYPVTNISVNSEQLDGLTVFNYPISMANGWNYVKQQLNDNRDYIYDMDLQSAEAYVNSEYAVALTELEV